MMRTFDKKQPKLAEREGWDLKQLMDGLQRGELHIISDFFFFMKLQAADGVIGHL